MLCTPDLAKNFLILFSFHFHPCPDFNCRKVFLNGFFIKINFCRNGPIWDCSYVLPSFWDTKWDRRISLKSLDIPAHLGWDDGGQLAVYSPFHDCRTCITIITCYSPYYHLYINGSLFCSSLIFFLYFM